MNENLNTNEQNASGQDTFNGQQPPQPPTFDGSQMPTFDGTQMPTFDGSQMPTFDGSQMPTFDGTQQSPTFDGSQQPTFDGSQMPMMPPPPMFGGMQPPPMMQGAPMWGNAGFAGEEMLNSNNFAPQNFGGQSDLSGIVDMNGGADISVNFGEQNNFANFAQGGMPPMFGGQGGQFSQPPQQAAQAQAE